jgi:hypothetical protein
MPEILGHSNLGWGVRTSSERIVRLGHLQLVEPKTKLAVLQALDP